MSQQNDIQTLQPQPGVFATYDGNIVCILAAFLRQGLPMVDVVHLAPKRRAQDKFIGQTPATLPASQPTDLNLRYKLSVGTRATKRLVFDEASSTQEVTATMIRSVKRMTRNIPA